MSTVAYDQDSDVVRWGLNLLDFGDSYANNVYCTTTSPQNSSYYDVEYRSDCHYHSLPSNVESDEMLAHALQEELSQLAVAEASGTSNAGDEHLQASILAQDWFGQSPSNYGHEEGRAGDSDDVDSSSSCSSNGDRPYDGEDWTTNLESDEFSAFDGEVGKRLNQMVPIPHVPRINGDIPSADEAISDHQRLLDRLQMFNLVELKVEGDGNCQFRALSDQFYRSPEHHKFVRQQVVKQLKSYPEIYEGYVPMAYGDYLKKLSGTGEWGDHVTLQAAADSYGIKIFVVTSFRDTCYIEILPNVQKSKRIIFLSFWAEVHYNSIYPEGEMPVFEETKRKKKWWNFRNKH